MPLHNEVEVYTAIARVLQRVVQMLNS